MIQLVGFLWNLARPPSWGREKPTVRPAAFPPSMPWYFGPMDRDRGRRVIPHGQPAWGRDEPDGPERLKAQNGRARPGGWGGIPRTYASFLLLLQWEHELVYCLLARRRAEVNTSPKGETGEVKLPTGEAT